MSAIPNQPKALADFEGSLHGLHCAASIASKLAEDLLSGFYHAPLSAEQKRDIDLVMFGVHQTERMARDLLDNALAAIRAS